MRKFFNLPIVGTILEFILITFGAMVAAFAIEEFLVPNTILDGGVVGISIMINNLTGIRLSLLTLVINIPFLIVGSKKMGRMFIVKSAFAIAVFSGFLEVFKGFANATS